MRNIRTLIESTLPPEEIITQEGTFNSKDHIASFSDKKGSNADVYQRGKGYYVEVSGDAGDYDMTAKDLDELNKKLKRDGFTYPPYSGGLGEATLSAGIGGKIDHMDGDNDDEHLVESGSDTAFILEARLLGEKLNSGRMSSTSYADAMLKVYKRYFPKQFPS